MNKSHFVLILGSLFLITLGLMVGCGSNPSSGGGGSPSAPFVADIYVAKTGSDEAPNGDGSKEKPYLTIQKGLNMATSHETVGVLAGTYTEEVTWPASSDVRLLGISNKTVFLNPPATKRAISILSGTVADNQIMTIEAITIKEAKLGTGGPNGAAIYITSTGNIILHLKDLVIKDNTAGYGAGIFYNSGALGTLIAESCTFQDNAAGFACAIYTNAKTLISNSLFKNNTETAYATVYFVNTSLGAYICNSTFEGNTGATGTAALYNQGTIVTVESCLFSSNSATTGFGGGYKCELGGTSFINKSVFNDNRAQGGGAVVIAGEAEIDKCVFQRNTAEVNSIGGAVVLWDERHAKITNSIFSMNKSLGSSAGQGGAIYINRTASIEEIFNCTFVSNEAYSGSAIYTTSGTNIHLANNIFYKNKNSTVKEIGAAGLLTGALIKNCSFIESHVTGSYTGNISNTTWEASFVSYPTNLRLKSDCRDEIKYGGTFESTSVTMPADDITGASRTPPYSMGAYEY